MGHGKIDLCDISYVTVHVRRLTVNLGMVLTGSPYFNEAGYDKQIGTSNGQLNSKNYNELVIVRLCDHIIASVRYVPPIDLAYLKWAIFRIK